ncbi:MAG: hypothetical protein JWN98_945 [Abditibacteriota bacterium]|nr:hypothetical protein [Abditibacteriota bacterium]
MVNAKTQKHSNAAEMRNLREQLRQTREAVIQAQQEAARYRSLVEHSEDLLELMSASGIILSYSASAQPILGYGPDVLIGTDAFDLVHPDDLPHVRAALELVFTQGRIQIKPYRVRRADGNWCWIETTATNRLDDPNLQAIVLDSRDVTHQHQMEGLVQQVLLGARCLLWQAEVTKIAGIAIDQAPDNDAPREDTLAGTEYEWQITIVNPQSAQEFLPVPISPGGTYADGFWQAKVTEDLNGMYDVARIALESGQAHYTQEYRVRSATGEVLWLHEDVQLERVDEAHWHLVGVCSDITQLKTTECLLKDSSERLERSHSELQKANLQLEQLARTDGLTGLHNHRFFQESLDDRWRIALRHGTPLSLLLLDVDCFKRYNDQFGHPAGDEVLKMVAQTLRDCTRSTDCAARYGGEEFAAILPHTDAAEALIVAERIRSAIETQVWPHRPITVSIGVCTYTSQLKENAELVSATDRALYRAKEQGRNCVVAAETTVEA